MYSLTPVTQPTADTKHPLLLLQSHHGDRYFFGMLAEGSQRSLTENRIRVSKLQNIFLAGRLDWSAIGGLPGMILTLADQGKDSLTLHYGSDILDYIVSTWRYFVFRFGLSLRTNVMKDQQVYKDSLLSVKSIVIQGGDLGVNSKEGGLFTEEEKSVLQSIVSNMFPKHAPTSRYDPSSDLHLNVELPNGFEMPQTTTSYEISFKPVRGRFKPEEAIRLGVPKGPSFGKLASGQEVILPNGTIVKPEDVLEKERHFPKVLVLALPDDSFVQSFQERFRNYPCEDLGLVYYFLGEDVTINEQIIRFMELFGESIQHVVSHPKVCPNSIAFKGAAMTVLKLKAMQMDCYNLPRTETVLSKEFYECFDKKLEEGTTLHQVQETPVTSKIPTSQVHVFTQNSEIQIESFTKGDEKMKIKLDQTPVKAWSWEYAFKKHVKPLNLCPASVEQAMQAKGDYNNFNTAEKSQNVEIMTLGTGSALPSKYRNVISTLLKIPYAAAEGKMKNRMVLLDAGENTIGTMRRNFSSTALQTIFKDLSLVYLSHLHADHHLGIISILKEWYKHNKHKDESLLYIVTPWQYNKFVNEWLLLEEPDLLKRLKYISCEHLINDSYLRRETRPLSLDEYLDVFRSKKQKRRKLEVNPNSSLRELPAIRSMLRDLNIASFQTCRAKHCNWAYSCSITFFVNSFSRRVFKVSYSGDTRPNIEKFSKEIGYRSDLLIHEATLDNELVEDAIKKRHCTINEAIQVSNEMEADKLILTHFSQRYPKVPQIDNNVTVKANEYCFAFDGMIVDFEKLGEQKAIFSKLNKAFLEERKEEEQEQTL
ncbi:hypothetical protein HG536_0H02540 [Torulaspora globosa]|uniref:ribonuclease Z n=1 Tax=Torulaspora globosa TaxID=48254 RepID=A0A7G3ZMZ3_9SACH|nr:uncharacterized protein HG536_0H02540 [Torulaspora globosa]QLL34879.1 hypothetical protein HG536_0H02540 [Torulaspora globosa]